MGKIAKVSAILLAAAGIGWVAAAWKYYDDTAKRSAYVRANLAPHAVYIRRTVSGPADLHLYAENKDVDEDGKYESVLEFRNPLTGEVEVRLIETYEGRLRLRSFEVVDGDIRYLQE